MEDKRIKKTKQQFRQALIALLSDRPFEQITVKSICDRADISRITFYAHYADKYELAEDIFQEMIALGTADYTQLQAHNNAHNDPILAYCNVLDTILDLYTTHFEFFQHTAPRKNPYLSSSFFSHVLEIVEHHAHKASSRLIPRYSVRAITAFLCFGLGGFISESTAASDEQIRRDTRCILRDILSSNILTYQKLPQSEH